MTHDLQYPIGRLELKSGLGPADLAASRMRGHIRRRREEATEAARMAFSRLYVPH